MLDINTTLQYDRYQIVEQISHDDVTATYGAFDTVRQESVVIKEFLVNLPRVATLAQREAQNFAFDTDAAILENTRHHYLRTIYDHFSEIDRRYLVMEPVKNETLDEIVTRKGKPFLLADLFKLADQLLEVLEFLHSQDPQLIHRDINPANLIIGADGKLKLLTFDATKTKSKKPPVSTSDRTCDEAVLNYRPLEQFWNSLDSASQKVIFNSLEDSSAKLLEEPPDQRSDIYALGATLYYFATARFPLDPLERIIDILDAKPDPLPGANTLNPGIPPEMSGFISKAMEIQREKRFESVKLMRGNLREVLGKYQQIAREVISAPPIAETSVAKRTVIGINAGDQTVSKPVPQPLTRSEPGPALRDLTAAESGREPVKSSPESVYEAAARKDTPEQLTSAAPIGERLAPTDPNSSFHVDQIQSLENIEPAPPGFEFSYSNSEKPRWGAMRFVAAFAALLILSGGIWGGYSMMSAKSILPEFRDANQELLSDDSRNKNDATNPPAEIVPGVLPDTASTSETTKIEQGDERRPVTARSDPSARSTQNRKPAVAAMTPVRKKPVTVDDIINDN